jgi:Sec-independent protein translocase protein TatA
MGRSMGHGFREFKDSITGDKKDEHDRFAVPTEESVALTTSAQDVAPAIHPVTGERTLSRFEREDEKVA